MPRRYTTLTFTDSVKQAQEHNGARAVAARMQAMDVVDDRLADREIDFIQQRDRFYVASVGEAGWPYVQFRGGPAGFLRVLDDRTLAYADFRGNRQYITTGNLAHDGRVALIFMDYANRRRLKVMARAEVLDAEEHPELTADVEDHGYRALEWSVLCFIALRRLIGIVRSTSLLVLRRRNLLQRSRAIKLGFANWRRS